MGIQAIQDNYKKDTIPFQKKNWVNKTKTKKNGSLSAGTILKS